MPLLIARTTVLIALAALIGVALAVLPALASAPSEVKLEVNENCVDPAWPCWATPGSGANPAPASKVTLATGGEVKFTDDTHTAAAVVWMGSAPACSGVPTSATTKWEGSCRFEQPGAYRFESSTLFNDGVDNYTKYEVLVEGAPTATTPTTTTTTTPTTTTTTTPTTPTEPSHGSPLEGGSRAVELATHQRGAAVHGSIGVSPAGAGARLEVGLFAAGAALAKAGHTPVRVGRLVRAAPQAGRVSFSVPLDTRGRAALRRRRRLALTVKLTLTPRHGAAVTATRAVVLHASTSSRSGG